MKRKDILHIKKEMKKGDYADKVLIGNYVKDHGACELVSSQVKDFRYIDEEEQKDLFGIFAKTLGGAFNKDSYVVPCANDVASSPLNTLRENGVRGDDVCLELLGQIANACAEDGMFSVIAVHGRCWGTDNKLYNSVLCIVCPATKEKSRFVIDKRNNIVFRNGEFALKNPSCAILYPASEGRQPYLSEALFYSKSAKEGQEDFLATAVHGSFPVTQKRTKEWFAKAIGDVQGGATLDQVESIQSFIRDRIAQPDGENANMDAGDIDRLMKHCGFEDKAREEVTTQFKEEFGKESVPVNGLLDTKNITITTGTYKVVVPEYAKALVQVQFVDGRKSLVLPLTENTFMVNGVQATAGSIIEA